MGGRLTSSEPARDEGRSSQEHEAGNESGLNIAPNNQIVALLRFGAGKGTTQLAIFTGLRNTTPTAGTRWWNELGTPTLLDYLPTPDRSLLGLVKAEQANPSSTLGFDVPRVDASN
jgi:hypothetical protein